MIMGGALWWSAVFVVICFMRFPTLTVLALIGDAR